MAETRYPGEYVAFDIQEFFDELQEKLERAKRQDLGPAVKEGPLWMFSIPEEVSNGKITKFFVMMVKENGPELELHYGASADGEFYQVSFSGVTTADFVKCVREITDHVYGEEQAER
jgi:hypothetical protein